ncbi:unnamed protein product [Ectocarpus sp. 8 AP-2014]
MRESAPPNRRGVSRDRSPTSKRVVRTIRLSKTSAPGATSNECTLKPFWDASTLVMSKRVLSPTEIGSVGTDLNSSSLSATTTARGSWSKTSQKLRGRNKSCLKICWPSVISLSRGTTGTAAVKPRSVNDVRARKIKLDPSPKWKGRLRQPILDRKWWVVGTTVNPRGEPASERRNGGKIGVPGANQQRPWNERAARLGCWRPLRDKRLRNGGPLQRVRHQHQEDR